MNSTNKTKKSELLLPVGDREMCEAAIHNGADAVYIGMPGFNARGRTKDHSLAELKEMISLCHLYGVKVHLAFNILLFEDELERARELLVEVLPLGIDAFIVQDLGLVRLIRAMIPTQVIHASTQMTITNELAMEAIADLNLKRFVLGREVSIPEMEKIRGRTDKELEVFVHGALCVAYSGQCFTSEAIGGRSANRGQCAQSCRLDYELIVDGQKLTNFERSYVVSPKDLYGLDHLGKLQEIGIDSFKVEGRLKGPNYVASIGRLYRSRIDQDAAFSLGLEKSDLERTFSRGFFSGWLEGVDHQQLVDGSYSNHRGELVGKVMSISSRGVEIESDSELTPGMGLLFVGGDKSVEDPGGFIYEVTKTKFSNIISLGKKFNLSRVKNGALVYLNKDPKLEKKLAQTYQNRDYYKRVPLKVSFRAGVDEAMELSATTFDGEEIQVSSDYKVLPSTGVGSGSNEIQKVLGALTGSAFVVEEWDFDMDQNIFIPQKFLKELKRKMLERLIERRTHREVTICEKVELALENNHKENASKESALSLLVRSQEQLKALFSAIEERSITLAPRLSHIILDYEFGKDYRKSLDLVRANRIKCFIATTRILKPGEYYNLNIIKRLAPDGVLVRNLGALEFFKREAPELPRHGDFSLNVTNSLSFDYLIAKGLAAQALGLDLNQWQMDAMLKTIDCSKAEVFIHHHMPEFHMEHCVFAAFLSQGSSFRDCGKPCESHKVAMKDPYGELHYLAADSECRNTMFRQRPISALSLLQEWRHRGVAHFRYEALWDEGAELLDRLLIYSDVLQAKKDVIQGMKELKALTKSGISLGQLDKKDGYVDRKQH